MSTDYHLICRDCKKLVRTVASGSIAYGNKLWTDSADLDWLRDFLFAHEGHNLVFLSEHSAETEEFDDNHPHDGL